MANINGTNGDDVGTIDGTIFRDTIQGLDGDDVFDGLGAGDLLRGNNGDDRIDGGDGEDRLEGGQNDDVLFGDNGDDDLFGGPGDDILIGGDAFLSTGGGGFHAGRDEFFGGAGNDEIAFSWEDGTARGDDGDDTLFAVPEGNTSIFQGVIGAIEGNAGIDTLSSGDPLNVFNARHKMSANLTTGALIFTFDPNLDGAGNLDSFSSTLAGIENLIGGAFADTLTGDEGRNVLTGNAGGDVLDGREDSDTLFDEGLAADAAGSVNGSGHDELRGGGGNDFIHSRAGHDEIFGGDDSDTIEVRNLTGVTVDGGSDAGIDNLLIRFAIAQTSGGGNFLLGNNGSVVGIERIFLESPGVEDNFVALAAPLLNSANGGSLDVFGGGGGDTIDGSRADNTVEVNLLGLSGGDTLTGGDAPDTLDGGGGNDTLDGGEGADTLLGNTGDDTFLHGTGNDTYNGGGDTDTVDYGTAPASLNPLFLAVSVDLGAGQAFLGGLLGDTLISIENATGSAFADLLQGSGVDNTLRGGGGADTLKGRAGDDTLEGNNGNDTLFGGGGNDTFDGGNNTDTVDYSEASSPVTIDLNLAGAQATPLGDDTLISIENLNGTGQGDSFLGSSAGNRFEGGAGGDTLTGRQGDDTLLGEEGADTLEGGQDDDVLNGGDGTGDTATYAGNASGVTVDLAITAFQNTAGAGSDRLLGVENLTGSDRADTLSGQNGANTLTGNGGDDSIDGRGGADNLFGNGGDDTLLGGAGVDTIDGGNLDDAISGGDDQDFLAGGGGADTFVYEDIADSGFAGNLFDVVSDFEVGVDTIDLSQLAVDFAVTLSFAGTAAANLEGQVRVFLSGGTDTIVEINLVDASPAEMRIRLTGIDPATIAAGDFIF